MAEWLLYLTAKQKICGSNPSNPPLLKHASGGGNWLLCWQYTLVVLSVTRKVNVRKCLSHMPPPTVNKAANSGFETQRIYHQKSKTGVSVVQQMDMRPTKFLK